MSHVCSKCTYATDCHRSYDRHVARKTSCVLEEKVNKHECDQCHGLFLTHNFLLAHSRNCTGAHALQCPICHKEFKDSSTKSKHIKRGTCTKEMRTDTPNLNICANVNVSLNVQAEELSNCPTLEAELLQSVTEDDGQLEQETQGAMSVYAARTVVTHEALGAMYLAGKTPIFGEDGSFLTHMRTNDGFLNATEMCTKTETRARMALRVKDFKAHTGGIGRLAAKAEAMNIPKDELTEVCKDLENKNQTWIHPCLIADLVTWCGLRVNVDAVNTLAPFIVQTSDCVLLQSLCNENGDLITDMRMSDGFINATKMCGNSDLGDDGKPRKFNMWEKKHREDLMHLSKRLQIGNDEQAVVNTGHDNILEIVPIGKYSGSWVHPRVAVQLAKWCVVKFNVQAKKLLNRHLPDDMQLDVRVRKPEPIPNSFELEPNVLLSDDRTLEPKPTPEVKFLQSLTGDDGQLVTEMRTSDGFINATKMCNSAFTKTGNKKRFPDWEDANKLFLENLATELDVDQNGQNRADLETDNIVNDKRYAYKSLIHVINGGASPGSWVHPRVAIKLAAWCSVKFDVQTNGLISRYTKGEVTSEESQAVASAIQSNIDDQLIVSHPLPVGYPDVKRRDVMDMTLGIPTHALPPNVSYVLRLGDLPDGDTLDKYGRTANFAVRMGSHNREHPGCQILMIVTTGTHDAKPIEDTLRSFFNGDKIDVEKPNGRMLTECFKSMSDIEYINKARELLLRTHSNIIETVHFNGEVYDYRPAYDKDALAIEQEKTKQIEEVTKQSEELTKQLTIRLELAKLGIST